MSTYDDIAGFDTSSLGLGAAALQGGQAGIDVANAAFANLSGAARFANGVALIEAAAADGTVSPVRALLAFTDRLNQLDGDASHFTAVGVEIAGLVASGDLEAAAAVVDFLPAVNALQIGRGEAASVLIAVADSGGVDVQLMAGCYLGQLITRGSFEGGEGGAWPGGNLSMTTAVQAIHNAVVGGSLGETQAYGLLAGLMVSPFPAPAFQPMNEMRALIGGDTGALHDVIDIFIASVGIIPFNVVSSAAGNIMSLVTPVSTPDLSLSELAAHVHAAVAAGGLTGEQAIAMVVRFATSYNADAIAAANDVAAQVIALVDDGFISQADALDMLRGTSDAARFLVAVAVADPDALPAVALRFATLVDTTTPTFMISGNMMTAQQAVTAINVGISLGGLSGASAVVMLTAMAFVPGGEVSSRNAMNAAADGVRGLLAGTIGGSDAGAAVVAALGPLGFTAEQGVTFLVALGASGFQQIFGSSVIWVNNADLAAAASLAIANLIHDHDLSSEAIGDALSAAFPLGVDSGELAVSTFIKAAPALAALEPDAYTIIGAALAQADAVSAGLAMGQVNDRVRGHDIDAEAGIAIIAGFAGAGTVEDQVAAGRELNAIVYWTGLVAADAIAEIDAAVVAGALTRGEAIVLLAGAATDLSPQGLANVLSQIATYVDADAAAGAGALSAAVTAGALTGTQGLFVLAQVAALGSADTASAATAALLSWVDDGAITASDAATQLLSLADGAMALRAVAGANIAAMVTHGALDAATAIALVEAAVPATLDADIAIVVLAHMSAAGDAALQSAVLDEINALIAGGDITLTNAIATLQALLPGASAALQAMVDEALAILLTDPATLAETAGLGSPAQVQAAVNAIVLLFSTDPTAAQGVLDALAGRIDSGDLGSDRAATLLAKIYARGGDAADAAFDAIVNLTTSLDVPASTMANAIAMQVVAGALDAATAFVAFAALSSHGSPINAAVAGLISGGSITVAALDAAVDAGQYSASSAIAVLGSVVPGAAPGLRAEALAEVQALVSETPALASQALPIFMGLAVSGDHALRLVGREGIEALAAAAPGVGSAAFLQLLSYMPVPDAAFLADTQAALNGLLAAGYLTVAEAIQHIDEQLSPSNASPLINAFQAVNILVALSAVDGARTAIYDYMRQEVAANSAAQAAGPSHPMWPFTAQPVIAALARGTVADLDHVEQTALVIVNISAILSTSQVVTSVAQGSIALIAVVAGFINRPDAMAAFGSYLAGRIAALPLSEQIDSLDVIGSLVGNTVDDLQLSDATELLLAVHAGGAKAAALAELADIGASVCFFIMAATTSGSTTLANGVEVMAALATSGAPGFGAAVANFLGDLLLGGQFTPAAVMSALEAAVTDDALTAQEMVALLQDVLVARLDPADLPATAALQGTILAEIDALIAANHVTFAEAVASMASSASGLSGAMLFAIGSEIVALVGGHAGSEAASVAAILAASTDGAIIGAEALGLLVGASIWGGVALQVAAGGGIAGLVAAGGVTTNTAAVGVYNAFLDNGLSLDGLVAVTAGAWANGGAAVGAVVLHQVASHGFETYAGLADRLVTAVEAGTLSVGDVIDGSVALVLQSGSAEAGADLLSALISQELLGAGDAVVALGAFITPSGLSASQAIALIAHLLADFPAAASMLGVGLANIAIAGHLSLSDAAAGLADLLDGGFAGLDFADVAALLVGAATVVETAGQAQTELVALIGSDAERASDAIDIISDAARDSVLTPAGAVALMVGIAAAGTQEQQVAVGRALDSLVHRSIVDAVTVFVTLTAEVEAGHMDGASAVIVRLQLVDDATGVDQAIGTINYLLGEEALSAAEATGAILAAVRTTGSGFASGNAVNVLIGLAQTHMPAPVDAVDRAVITQAGAVLADLVAGGEILAPGLLQSLAWPASAVVPLLAAIEVSAGAQSALGQGAHASLLNALPQSGQAYDLVQAVADLIGPQGLTAAQGLPILVDMAIHGGVVAQIAVGHEFGRLLAEHVTTTADLHSALYANSVSNQAGAMVLAAMIDPDAAAIPVAVQALIVANVRLPQGAESWEPYIQPLIAALSNAVISEGPVVEATGLRLGQAVLAISSYARVGDTDVMHDAGVAIAALATFYHATDRVFALLGRALVSDPPYGNLAGRQIAEVGVALGFTPEQTAEAVANGTDHGLTPADVIAVLARLTGSDPVAYHLASGAAIVGLTDDQFTSSQAIDVLLHLSGITPENMALLLAGFAGAGTTADQFAAGRAMASLPPFDFSVVMSEIPANAIDMIALGIASSDAPGAEFLLIALLTFSGGAQIPAMMTALGAAIDAGTMSAADALHMLVQVSFQVANEFGDEALALRTNLHEQLVSIVQDHLDVDDAIGFLLESVSATAHYADRMRAEVGGMLAALVDAGLASATTVITALTDALTAGTSTGAEVAAFIAGAALNREYTNPFPNTHDFAVALGHALGGLIEAGTIGVGDALAGVLASQAAFRMAWPAGEVTMLAVVAGHDAAGLQLAVGHALAAFYQSGSAFTSEIMQVFDAMVGAPDGLSAQQAMGVLFTMADDFEGGVAGLGGLYQIATEVGALIGRGAVTAQAAADGITTEISVGHYTSGYGLAFLAYVTAANGAFTGAAAGGIAELIDAGLTRQQAIDALLGAANTMPADLAVARIIGTLANQDIVTYAHAGNAIVAAQGDGRLSVDHATAIMISLAETADEIGMGFLGHAFGDLIERGLDPVAVHTALYQALQGNLVSVAQASSLVAYVMGAITNLPNADDYQYALAASVLAQAPSEVGVGAVDRAYELGGIDAHDVVGLMTWMHGVAGTHTRWFVGHELWKMFEDGGVALEDIFEQVVAHNALAWMQGSLIGAMAATPTADTAQQIAVGHALGEFISNGGMTFSDAVMGLGLTGLSGEQFAMLLVSVAGGGGSAEQLGVGRHFGGGLAGIPVGANDVDLGTIEMFDNAVAAGALTVPELVGVLIGMGMVQYPSPYAVRTSVYALDALVTSGRITVEGAMALVDGMVPSLDPAKLIYWLANASRLPGLHDAVAIEIVELVADGVLSATQAFGYIDALLGEPPQGTAYLLNIPGDAAAQLAISIAGHGDTALQDAAGTLLASLTFNGSFLPEIAAAVTNGSLSPEGAVHVIANLVAALASDPSATVRNWAISQLDHYVDDGLVDAPTVSSVLAAAAGHATTTGLSSLGAIIGALGGGFAGIHDAIADGSLAAEHGLALLLSVGTVRDIGDPVFQAARDEIVALVQAGALTGTEVLAAARAAGAAGRLSESHVDVIAFSIFGDGSAADDAAVGAYVATRVDHLGDRFGVGDDTSFTGILDPTGVAFLKVQNGQMTAAEAIAYIKEYAAEHDVSAYAGIFALEGLFGRYQNFSARQLAHDTRVDMIALGDLAAELAGRVAEGTTSAYVRSAQGGIQFEAADPSALTRQEALQVLNWEAGLAFTQDQVALARYMFANDLWVAQQVRLDSSPSSPISMTNVVNGMLPGNPYLNTSVPDVGRSGYAYDLALVSLLERVTAPDRVPDQQDCSIALEALSTRLTKGIAQDALISQYVAGNLTFAQVLEALDTEVAATGLGSTPAHQQLMHSMSMAWLQLRAREYIAEHPGTGGAIEAAQFMQQLRDPQYGDELLTGYGALLAMSSSGAGSLVSALDKQAAYEEAFVLIRSRTPVNTPLSDRDQAVLDALIPMANGMQWAFDKVPIGRAFLTVGEDPTDAAAYARLGAHVGTIFANKLAVDAMFAGTPWGAAITAAKFGAQVGLFVLSMGAVQDALGEGPTLYLRGQLTMAGATASLLGDTISDLGQAGAEIAIQSAPHFIAFSDAVNRGDAAGIASSIGEIAMDYYKLQTGVDLRLYGAVGDRFADLMVHLFTGDTGALGDDVRALGSAYLDTIIQNPYLAAIGERMVQYAGTINQALTDINDSYRILGQNALTGLLLVGTRLDDAGNAIRDVAHKVGGFFSGILHGLGIDGYISGATVFADANFNGVLDAGELSTTTDANGRYAITSNGAPLVLQGGFDIATNLPFTGTMQAPAGSTAVTPLTTLIQQVAASTSGDPFAAQQLVASALGLNPSIDLNDFDPITATRTGVAGAADAFATASSIINTVSLLQAAGATDAYEALAARIVSARTLDLTDAATIIAVAASAGVSAGITSTVAQLATASNALAEQAVASGGDPMRFMRYVTAVSIAAQGDTAHDLAAAGADAGHLANVLAQHTGANLANQVAGNRAQVGGFGDNGGGGGEVPLQISADGHGIELALNGSSSVAGNWVRLAAQDSGLHAGSTVLVYSIDAAGNHQAGSDLTLSTAPAVGVGRVEDDHGARMLLGAQSVYLAAGEQLRFAVLDGNQTVDVAPSMQLAARGDGSLQATIGGLHLTAVTNNSMTAATTLAEAQRDTGDAFVFLRQGETLNVELAGSSANANTLAFVRVDIDAATGARSVAGVAYGNTAAFTEAVRSHMDGGFHQTHGGDFAATANWKVAGATGYYAPVLVTPNGQIFVVGTANADGHEHIRAYGENTFGFEDLASHQGSDFDYNDMVMRLHSTRGDFS